MTNECKERKELGYHFSLLGEDFGPVSNDENVTDKYIWYYSVKETDFFLEKIKSWYSLSTDVYEVKVDRYVVLIPEGFYILIGDVEGKIDWINVDTIISRSFEAFIVPGTLDKNTWQILPLEIVGHQEDCCYYYPFLKNPITPIYIGNNKCILVSNKDMYPKTKNFDFPDFV